MALTTLQYVKDMLGITSNTLNTQLDAFRVAAEQVIKTDCDRDFESAAYVEYYTGTGTKALPLRQTPVTAISSVYLDFAGYFGQGASSPFSSVTLLAAGVDYTLQIDKNAASYSGILWRIGTVWSEINRSYTSGRVTQEVGLALGNIKVSYTAGYTTIPLDIQYCVVMLIQRMRLLIKYGAMLESEKLRDYSYKLAPTAKLALAQLGDVQRTLRMYKRSPW